MLSFGFSGKFKSLPKPYLLYLPWPNSDSYLIGEDTEVGEGTYIWAFDLGSDSTIRAATGWTLNHGWETDGHPFYYDDGTSRPALATEINSWVNVNTGGVVFKLISATEQLAKLVIYDPLEITLINKAKARLRIL